MFQFIIVFGLVNYEPLKYNEYEYPTWVNIIGMMVAASSVLCIPITALVLIARTPGTLKEVSSLKFKLKHPYFSFFSFHSASKYYANHTKRKEESCSCFALPMSPKAWTHLRLSPRQAPKFKIQSAEVLKNPFISTYHIITSRNSSLITP